MHTVKKGLHGDFDGEMKPSAEIAELAFYNYAKSFAHRT